AGGLYGWLAEGALVGTLYGTEASAPFPLSLLCTGLSWHALISVLLGWYLLRSALSHRRPWPALGGSLAIGLFWGLWATFLWRETPPMVVPVAGFLTHAMICTVLLALSYVVLNRLPLENHRPGWFGLGFSLLVLGVFYSEQVRVLGWRPILVLPPLILGVLVLLWKARERGPQSPDEIPAVNLPVRNLLGLLAIPLTATGVYAAQLAAGLPGLPPNLIFQTTILVAGAVLAWAIFRVLRPAGRSAADVD
ncbi:MAG: hypothetical protein ACYDC1_18985, partial [Limisphaerales bacterium]